MSEENDPKPAGESPDSGTDEKQTSDDSAAAAKEAAKDFANNAGEMFKGLDQKMQIYLIAMGVTLLCSMFFGAFKLNLGILGSTTTPSLLGLSGYFGGTLGGKLAFLGSGAGVGILIWSNLAKRKDPWIPLAIAGSAGAAALGILMTRLGQGGSGSAIDGTLLGWWLPLAGAVTATVVSVQRILNADKPPFDPNQS